MSPKRFKKKRKEHADELQYKCTISSHPCYNGMTMDPSAWTYWPTLYRPHSNLQSPLAIRDYISKNNVQDQTYVQDKLPVWLCSRSWIYLATSALSSRFPSTMSSNERAALLNCLTDQRSSFMRSDTTESRDRPVSCIVMGTRLCRLPC